MWSKRVLGAGLAATMLMCLAGCSGSSGHPYEVVYTISGSGTSVAMRDIAIDYIGGDEQHATDTTSSTSPNWSTRATLPPGSTGVYLSAQTVGDDPHYTLTCSITVNGVQAATNTGWYTCTANVDLEKS